MARSREYVRVAVAKWQITLDTLDYADADLIVANSSGGKDSAAMLDEVVARADAAGVRDRVIVAHASLGRMEWPGTTALARTQAERYGLRFETCTRAKGDLETQIRDRGMWPSSDARYCTSDQKRDQIQRLITRWVAELGITGRPARVLNCMGLRGQESTKRAKRPMLAPDMRGSSGTRVIYTHLPILHWTVDQVWERIRARGIPYHDVYDRGMSRLSCSFCVLASQADLICAARLRPDYVTELVALESEIGHRFREDLSMAEIQAMAQNPTLPEVA
ncbi:phosphoadenosine phosphosulfate reductase family protein [Embleya sp. NPDC005575]|uniref:phosphoadenosine phosphosulfate reductase family protein n=1 Tax=Embleya sp. NPDC005575 TaxID=3156892 RepID=UPI0033ADCC70